MADAEMPKYECHKIVRAFKIAAVLPGGGLDGAVLTPVDEERCVPVVVCPVYLAKHRPKAGGYFVVYEDGYQSFSPAEAFEAGYTRVEDDGGCPAPEPDWSAAHGVVSPYAFVGE